MLSQLSYTPESFAAEFFAVRLFAVRLFAVRLFTVRLFVAEFPLANRFANAHAWIRTTDLVVISDAL